MDSTAAVKQIRNSIFKPGWAFSAFSVDETHIAVRATIKTVDTSYADAVGNFYKPLTLNHDAMVDVSDLDQASLCYELVRIGMEVTLHEDREFVQVRQDDGSWYSPLHPHTYAGETAWQRAGGTKGVLRNDDLDDYTLSMLALMEMAPAR